MASRGAAFAILAGLIGTLAWGAASYFTGWGLGFAAIIVGAFVGLGMILGCKSRGSFGTGALCVVVALVCVAAGKFVLAEVDAYEQARFAGKVSDIDAINQYASEVYDYYAASARHMSPAGPEGWPPEVYSEAKRLWAETPLAERDEYMLAMARDARRHAEENRFNAGASAFMAGFGPVNLVILGLTVVTAYKTGSWNKEAQLLAAQDAAAAPQRRATQEASGGITGGPFARAQPAGSAAAPTPPAHAAAASPSPSSKPKKKKGKHDDDDEDHHSAGIFSRLGQEGAPKAADPGSASQHREAA